MSNIEKTKTLCVGMLVAILALAVVTQAYGATIISLDAIDRGSYEDDGYHFSGNDNYIVGDLLETSPVHRNFFVFDLNSVGQQIIGAELQLYNPRYGYAGFHSVDRFEIYSLFDVSTDLTILRNGSGGVAAFNDLGTGTFYGSYRVSSEDNGETLLIPLNLAAINDLNSTSGSIALGGAITSLNSVNDTEVLFGGSGNAPSSRLKLTLIPEPAAIGLLAVVGCMVICFRIRRGNKPVSI